MLGGPRGATILGLGRVPKNGEIFYSLKEAQIVIEKWRVEYNTRRLFEAYEEEVSLSSTLWGDSSDAGKKR
jgi:hypothetical protein